MKNMKKHLLALGAVALLLTASVFAGTRPGGDCFTVLVGKKASADGSVIVAHNEDDPGDIVVNVRKIQGRDYGASRRVALGNGATYETEGRVAGFLWIEAAGQEFADSFVNDHGVVITSDSCPSRETAEDLTDGGIGHMLRRLMAEKARTAREAVEIAGELVEKYGYRGSGRTYSVADKDEAWMIAVIRGRHWFAQRVPDDEVAVIPNWYTIRRIRTDAPGELMGSPDIVAYARGRGWYEEAKDGSFDFKKAFQRPPRPDPIMDGNTLRHWRGLTWLSGREWEKNGDYPFSFTPAQKVSAESLMALLRDHYEGTSYDATDGYQKGTPNHTKFRTICTTTTINSFIASLNGRRPAPISVMLWLALGRPDSAAYLPVYYGVDELPPGAGFGPRTHDDAALYARHFDDAWLRAEKGKLLQTKVAEMARAVEADYGRMIGSVRGELGPAEASFVGERRAFESEFASLYARDKVAAQKKLDDHIAAAFAEVSGLYDKLLAKPQAPASSDPVVKCLAGEASAGISFLSWDTEGGDRVDTNLLRADAAVRLQGSEEGAWREPVMKGRRVEKSGDVLYDLEAGRARLSWKVEPGADRGVGGGIKLVIGAVAGHAEGLRLLFPFDPKVTPTTVLPAAWLDDGTFRLPAMLNAPDFGPMLLEETGGREVRGRLEGSRKDKVDDLILDLPGIGAGASIRLTLTPVLLAAPPGLRDAAMWRQARRGWLNALQPCARWGEQGKPFSSPPGILGNNVISDPASMSVWFYADQAFFTPEPAPGVPLMPLIRRTVDYWLTERMKRDASGAPTGEVTGYWDYGGFLDANASPLIAAWDYVEATGDTAWLTSRIGRLELVADFLARRDIDGDGLVEAVQSGNRGALVQPNRSCAWWDALNCGYKDGYTNALIYRAWRSLADLESRLGRGDRAAVFARLAGRLKAAYAKALFNPKTGWLAWWKSADGELHDYASPTLNGLAIEYGLVDPALGRQILDRLWGKMREAGFARFDLGVPPMLVPVHRSDYLQPDAIGIPEREDGTDTFGWYMNGGITAGQVLHFLAAHYVLGEGDRADRVLRAMLGRQALGGFENGVRDAGGQGIDWTSWNGQATGYEGYLADSFRFLQAVLLRQPEFRARLYRPLEAAQAPKPGTGPRPGEEAGPSQSGVHPSSRPGSPAAVVPDARIKENIAFLERTTKKLLDGCLIMASDGTPLYTPDGKAHYAALWTRDFASMVENAGYLMSEGIIRRCIDRLVKGVTAEGLVPDRVQADGRAVYAAGAADSPLGEPNIDNAQFLVFAVTSYLKMIPEDRRGSFYKGWSPALIRGMDWIPRGAGGLVWNDPRTPHSPYGFTDTVAKTGDLFMESVLYWRAAKMVALWEDSFGSPKARDDFLARAAAIEKKIGSLWDEKTGMFLAASVDCRQTDIWGNAYAVAVGFPLAGRRARIVDYLVSNYGLYVWRGQVRHLPRGEYWQRQLYPVEKDRYQNGAFWGTASGWVMQAVSGRAPELAARMFRDLVEDFREGGICECVNEGYRQLESYVNTATNPLGAARRLWRQ